MNKDKNRSVGIEQLKLALNNVGSYIYIKDENSKYLYANQLMLELLGCREEELSDHSDDDLFSAGIVARSREVDLRVLQGEHNQEEIVFENADGMKTVFWEVKTPVFSSEDPKEIIGVLGVSTDITETKYLEKELKELAIKDELTALYNRRYFNEIIEREISRAKRDGNSLCLMMIDIDHLKSFNDTYGHIKGDDVVQKVAKIFQHHAKRASDYVFRLGGEEFAILLNNIDNIDSLKFAEDVRKAVKELKIKYQDSIEDEYITVSIGIVVQEAGELNTPDELYILADEALYDAKTKGRDRIVLS